jgi:6-phosphogluconate dehydrogenase
MLSREAVMDRRISGVEDQRITCQPVQQSSISEWQRMPNGWLQHLKHSLYYIKIP